MTKSSFDGNDDKWVGNEKIIWVLTAALTINPTSQNIYGKQYDVEDLLISIKDQGIMNPLVATPDLTLIDGHRRLTVAKQLGLEKVPVVIKEFPDDLARRKAVITYNLQRNTTFSQQMREAAVLEDIERERAKQRQGTRTDLVDECPQGNDDDTEFGKSREKIATMVGIGSGRTYARAQRVWKAAQDGDPVAQELVAQLDKGEISISRACERIKDDDTANENTSGDAHETGDSSQATDTSLTGEGDDTTNEDFDTDDTDQPESDNSSSADEGDATEQLSPTDSTASNDSPEDEPLDPEELILATQEGTSDEIFSSIFDLHIPDGASIADPTFGKGTFWKGIPDERYTRQATDLDPARSPDSEVGIDCRDLPYLDNVFDGVVLDPPFTARYEDTDWFTRSRFDGDHPVTDLDSQEKVTQLYYEAGKEAYRVLREDGILVVKVQDVTHAGKQHFHHIKVANRYQEYGFRLKDIFILKRKDIPATPPISNQRHARKNHSYFLIFIRE